MKRLLGTVVLVLTGCLMACQNAGNSNNANHAAADNHNDNANTRAGETAKSGSNDGWITLKNKLALIADKRTSGFQTDVDTKDGVVTLSGKVDTAEAKSGATEVARGIDGVKSVDNQLQVVPEAKRKEVNAADDKIEDGIKTAMKNDAKLKDLSLTSKVNAGVVTLDGSVDTQQQLYDAAQAVRAVAGVKSVDTRQVKVKNEGRS
jgi:osmotically-inducible protein OsmY